MEFYVLLGHHQPRRFPAEAIIDHFVFTENVGAGQIVPEPGRENFRFNLWLNDSTPFGGQPVEVVIHDFQFIALLPGDFDWDGIVDGHDFLKWQRGESPNPLSHSDLFAWETNYGMVAPLSASSAAVPEPNSLALLCLGGLLSLRSFRRVTSVTA